MKKCEIVRNILKQIEIGVTTRSSLRPEDIIDAAGLTVPGQPFYRKGRLELQEKYNQKEVFFGGSYASLYRNV
jgi:hypothetical protein